MAKRKRITQTDKLAEESLPHHVFDTKAFVSLHRYMQQGRELELEALRVSLTDEQLAELGKILLVQRDLVSRANLNRHFFIGKVQVPLAASQMGDRPRLRPPISTERLSSAVDLIPGPGTRKMVGKMVADQVATIRELESKGRYKTAKWTHVCTWGLMVWYVALHTVSSVSKAVRGKIAG